MTEVQAAIYEAAKKVRRRQRMERWQKETAPGTLSAHGHARGVAVTAALVLDILFEHFPPEQVAGLLRQMDLELANGG